jgi:molecular chaperone DnaK (HSP70)
MSHFLYSGRQKLTYNAENVKHILSTLDTANCYIESLYEGIDFNANVTRARFENELAKVSLTFLFFFLLDCKHNSPTMCN